MELICASLNERIEGFFDFTLLQQTCWHDKLILCINIIKELIVLC